jgi:putative transposase
MSVEAKRALVEADHSPLSQRRQCALLGIARSGVYYQPVAPSPETVAVLHALDVLYTAYPFYGSRRMTHELRGQGYPVNRKRVGRLMRALGLAAIYPGPRTTIPHPGHMVYPYHTRRPHQSLNYCTPSAVYWDGARTPAPKSTCATPESATGGHRAHPA